MSHGYPKCYRCGRLSLRVYATALPPGWHFHEVKRDIPWIDSMGKQTTFIEPCCDRCHTKDDE